MAFFRTALVLAVLACISYVSANEHEGHEGHEDLSHLVAHAEENLKNATTHVNHMLGLDPLPNPDKLQPLVKRESEHMAYELKKFAGKLQDAVKEGEHQPEVKDAVASASSKLTDTASSLEHAGNDLKQDNTHYLAAAENWLQALKEVKEKNPCDKVAPIIKDSLKELNHDVDNYQWGIHNVIGAHEGSSDHAGHHHDGSHHVHNHGGSSSEESHESHESKEHGHHSHH